MKSTKKQSSDRDKIFFLSLGNISIIKQFSLKQICIYCVVGTGSVNTMILFFILHISGIGIFVAEKVIALSPLSKFKIIFEDLATTIKNELIINFTLNWRLNGFQKIFVFFNVFLVRHSLCYRCAPTYFSPATGVPRFDFSKKKSL